MLSSMLNPNDVHEYVEMLLDDISPPEGFDIALIFGDLYIDEILVETTN